MTTTATTSTSSASFPISSLPGIPPTLALAARRILVSSQPESRDISASPAQAAAVQSIVSAMDVCVTDEPTTNQQHSSIAVILVALSRINIPSRALQQQQQADTTAVHTVQLLVLFANTETDARSARLDFDAIQRMVQFCNNDPGCCVFQSATVDDDISALQTGCCAVLFLSIDRFFELATVRRAFGVRHLRTVVFHGIDTMLQNAMHGTATQSATLLRAVCTRYRQLVESFPMRVQMVVVAAPPNANNAATNLTPAISLIFACRSDRMVQCGER